MLPGPGILALIAPEAIERDRQRTLRARGPQARIDLVQRPRGCWNGEGVSNTLGQPVEIMGGAERLGAIGFDRKIAGEKKDQVEI